MKITSKGQVTIPIHVRQQMNLLPNTEVEFLVKGKDVILRKVKGESDRGRRVVAALRGKATTRMTTEEIMALTRGE